ncbi:MAG: aminotransferase class V-fold PLP-dependent enzyme, partial [Acidimicrobiales bacterium]
MTPAALTLDVERVRKDFPIYDTYAGRPFVFLDSAASSQKPRAVLDAMTNYYETTHANVHRGVYAIAEHATELYEGSRARIARFIGASSSNEVIFAKNVTETLNLVAQTWGRANLGPDDAVLLTE